MAVISFVWVIGCLPSLPAIVHFLRQLFGCGIHCIIPRHQSLLHRPHLDPRRLTPDNPADLLFDDVLWVSQAQAEHDAFADVLRSRGVVVHYYGDLLAQTLDIPAAREYILDRVFDPRRHGPLAAATLRAYQADWTHFSTWCDAHGFVAVPAAPAVVGAYPEPFLHGDAGKRLPVRIDWTAPGSPACRTVTGRLRAAGVPAALGALGSEEPDTLTVLVGPWSAIRADPAAEPAA